MITGKRLDKILEAVERQWRRRQGLEVMPLSREDDASPTARAFESAVDALLHVAEVLELEESGRRIYAAGLTREDVYQRFENPTAFARLHFADRRRP